MSLLRRIKNFFTAPCYFFAPEITLLFCSMIHCFSVKFYQIPEPLRTTLWWFGGVLRFLNYEGISFEPYQLVELPTRRQIQIMHITAMGCSVIQYCVLAATDLQTWNGCILTCLSSITCSLLLSYSSWDIVDGCRVEPVYQYIPMQISFTLLLYYFRRWTFIGDVFVHTFFCGFIDLVLSSILPIPVPENPEMKKEEKCWSFFGRAKTAKVYQEV